jgi:hypothetical protein
MPDNFSNIHLVTFGGGSGYKRSANKLIRKARKSKIFSTCEAIDDSDSGGLSIHTMSNIAKINSMTHTNKGFGLWVWKPDVILNTMSRTKENDIIVYVDAGCTLNLDNPQALKRLHNYASFADDSGLFAMQLWDGEFAQRDLTDNFWGSSELNELLEPDEYSLNTNQIQAGILFVKNIQVSREFIENWKAVMLMDDFKYLLGQSTKEYRYDQSIFSILYKKSKYPTIPDETYFEPDWKEFGKHFPIWATRINDGVNPFKHEARDLLFRLKRKIIKYMKCYQQ